MRELKLYINTELVGILFEGNDIWSFQYAQEWLDSSNNYALCADIPLSDKLQVDGSSKRHIQWFFDNLLPEEGARTLLARDINVNEADSFGILMIVGAESAGAITLSSKEIDTETGRVTPLTFDELNSRIACLPDIPLNNAQSKRMSIAGAQHKMLVVLDDDKFYEPVGNTPSSHILKPEHSTPDLYWQTVRNEWFVMNLAKSLGLNVPNTFVYYFPAAVYVIERFDRKGLFPRQERVHALDACQTLGLSRSVKYALSNVEQLNQFAEVLRGKGATKIALFNWAIFNAVVGNTDAHLKNLSCLAGSQGAILSPMYDLICTAIYEGGRGHLNAELSQPMGNAKTLGELTREDIFTFGNGLGLPQKLCLTILDKLLNEIETKADKLILHVEGLSDIPHKAGELRMLREIRYKLISEMVNKLK
ncbi:HipA domain-containing protein [Psychromonas sp. KJ10-10]|uniref:HipA domain-containing protein n=1 Tax=Psychromonas sp. KJ10-10 TaxID=3391823 RepID=UPI0039B6C62D